MTVPMSPKFELLKRLKAFIGAEGRSPASSQTVYFVAHNLNHYRLMAETCEILGAAGNATMFVCVELAKTAPELIAHWDRIKLPYLGLIRMQQMIRKGDIVVVCNDWGPRYLIDALHRIQRSGAKVIGLVEGTRFQMPGRYELVDELLVWGPSGSEAFEVPTHIVGSPGLEGDWVGSRVRQRGRRCLINYKFTYDERKADQDFGWLEKVTSAAHACGTECTISLHPANDPLPANYSVSDKPILELLQDACVVVTRSSTVVYEAL